MIYRRASIFYSLYIYLVQRRLCNTLQSVSVSHVNTQRGCIIQIKLSVRYTYTWNFFFSIWNTLVHWNILRITSDKKETYLYFQSRRYIERLNSFILLIQFYRNYIQYSDSVFWKSYCAQYILIHIFRFKIKSMILYFYMQYFCHRWYYFLRCSKFNEYKNWFLLYENVGLMSREQIYREVHQSRTYNVLLIKGMLIRVNAVRVFHHWQKNRHDIRCQRN